MTVAAGIIENAEGLIEEIVLAGKVLKSDRKCKKIMWLILFLLSSSVGIYLVIESFINYFSFDVVTSIKVFKEIPTELPAITFYILRNNKASISLRNLVFRCKFNNLLCNISKDIRINKL